MAATASAPTGPHIRNQRVRQIISDANADPEKRQLAEDLLSALSVLRLLGITTDIVRVVDLETKEPLECTIDEFREANRGALSDDDMNALKRGEKVTTESTVLRPPYSVEVLDENVFVQDAQPRRARGVH